MSASRKKAVSAMIVAILAVGTLCLASGCGSTAASAATTTTERVVEWRTWDSGPGWEVKTDGNIHVELDYSTGLGHYQCSFDNYHPVLDQVKKFVNVTGSKIADFEYSGTTILMLVEFNFGK